MRTVRIDFSAENMLPDGEFIGRMGEHNATDLVITPPAEMSECGDIVNYVAAFVTEGKIIRSAFYGVADTVTVPLCSQLTQDHTLSVQLEGYDGEGGLLVKSAVLTGLKLLPSAGGDEADYDSENGGMVSQINLNTLARHTHSNSDVLGKLGEDGGILTYNGESVTSPKTKTVVLDAMTGEVNAELYENEVLIYYFSQDVNTAAALPVGSKLVSVEYNLVNQDEDKWTNINDIIESGVYSPYFINMNKVFESVGQSFIAAITFINQNYENEFCSAAANYMFSKFRITFIEADSD